MHVDIHALNSCTRSGGQLSLGADAGSFLAVAAVPKFSVFRDLQFGGVGGGDAVARLHVVALLQLAESAHQTRVGSIQWCYALLLWMHMNTVRPGKKFQYYSFLISWRRNVTFLFVPILTCWYLLYNQALLMSWACFKWAVKWSWHWCANKLQTNCHVYILLRFRVRLTWVWLLWVTATC